MPTGPKGEKRPADVIARAVKVMRILTDAEPEDYGLESATAQELGRKGAQRLIAGGPSAMTSFPYKFQRSGFFHAALQQTSRHVPQGANHR
jgi:hypothetical protein